MHFTRKKRSLLLSLRTAWCLKTGRTKQGLPKSSSGPLPVPIQSYRSSTSRSTVRPESRLGSTKPEPIMACGCTGKLPVNGVSIRLFVAGWSFPQDVMALLHASRPSAGFSRVPVNRPPPSSEFEVHLELEVMGLSSSWLSHLPYESLNQPRLRA